MNEIIKANGKNTYKLPHQYKQKLWQDKTFPSKLKCNFEHIGEFHYMLHHGFVAELEIDNEMAWQEIEMWDYAKGDDYEGVEVVMV
jgi:hypothetical protein